MTGQSKPARDQSQKVEKCRAKKLQSVDQLKRLSLSKERSGKPRMIQIISTEGALKRPMTHENYPSYPSHPKSLFRDDL